MSEINVGDEVTCEESSNTWHVVAIDGPFAWCKGWVDPDSFTAREVRRTLLLDILTKIEPRFEVGKSYKRSETHRDSVQISEVRDEWVVGWWTHGAPWTGRQCNRQDWVEVL